MTPRVHPCNIGFLEDVCEMPHTNVQGERTKRYLRELLEAYAAQEQYIEDADKERDDALGEVNGLEKQIEELEEERDEAERERDRFERERDELQEQLDQLRASINQTPAQAVEDLRSVGATIEVKKGRKRK